MNKRISVGMAAAMLSATFLSAPGAAAKATPDDPADTWPPSNARTVSGGSVAPSAITPAMKREINRVVAANRRAARVAPASSARALAGAQIRCATFETQRYCLRYGWTNRTAAELRRDLVKREANARRTSHETGDASILGSLRNHARMAPRSQARADRAELRQAARSTSKILELRHDIQGTPYPRGYFARHPEADRTAATARKRRYPKRYYVLNWHHTRQQHRSYWCGPATMQLIAWGCHGGKKPRTQKLWARRLGTTTSGTTIWSMVKGVNRYTGFDKERYAGRYIVLDISDWGYRKWLRLHRRHYAQYNAPIVMHPVLKARYFPYMKGWSGSGH
ncbi:MAG: hypothetical protein L0K86_11720, partial [Actinomycetia bacterium]|nr:hypothetical protein [Actinomycetes bacterium]